MNRSALAHTLRAAADVLDEHEFMVVGSAAIFGSFADFLLPGRLALSREVDLVPPDDEAERKATKLEAAIGEFSQFHTTHGFYVDGVSAATAKLPVGWASRVVPFAPADANGAIGWCVEPSDLCAAKLIAGRHKDMEFVTEAAKQALIMPTVVAERLSDVATERRRIEAAICRARSLPTPAGLLSPTLDTSGRPDHDGFEIARFTRVVVSD